MCHDELLAVPGSHPLQSYSAPSTAMVPQLPTVETYYGGSSASDTATATPSSADGSAYTSTPCPVRNVLRDAMLRLLDELRRELVIQIHGGSSHGERMHTPMGRWQEPSRNSSLSSPCKQGYGGCSVAFAESDEHLSEEAPPMACSSTIPALSSPHYCICDGEYSHTTDDGAASASDICLGHLEVSIVPIGEDMLVQGHVLMAQFEVNVQVRKGHWVAVYVPGQLMTVHFGGVEDNFAVEEVYIDLNVTSLAVGLLQAVGDCYPGMNFSAI